jgi:hypothetical protein
MKLSSYRSLSESFIEENRPVCDGFSRRLIPDLSRMEFL